MNTKITDLVDMDEVKLNMARCTWKLLRAGLEEWTPEVANAVPRGKLYEIKYMLSRLPYTMKGVPYAHSLTVIENYGYVKKTIKDTVTTDHFFCSYTTGEFALDNPDTYLADGTLEKFSMELYPFTFLTNWLTQEENKKLSNLKGIELTQDKYAKLGIKLYIDGEQVENPELPEGFTEWEDEKYFPNSLYRLCA